MKRLLLCAAAALLVVSLIGCTSTAERTTLTSNPAHQVDVLFTDREGYTVKRFWSGGEAHYYATPGPAVVVGRVRTGKNSSRPVSVATVGPR